MKKIFVPILAAIAMLSAAQISNAQNVRTATGAPSVEQKTEAISVIGSDLQPSKTVLLYPDGVEAALKSRDGKGKTAAKLAKTDPGYAAMQGPKWTNCYADGESLERDEEPRKNGFIAYVSDSARVDIYLPEHPNGQMVISTPGGSYKDLSTWNEGKYVAKWMLERGIAVGVLKYRLPGGHWQVPLQDVHNAFRYCRANASQWGIDQVGIIGFSAGGHLASTAVTMYADSVTRPDFGVLIYPVISMDPEVAHLNTRKNLIGDESIWGNRASCSFDEYYERQKQFADLQNKYSTEKNVTSDTPQLFIALSADDGLVPAKNSLLFYRACAKAKVPTELHVYPKGGHGWGFTDDSIVASVAARGGKTSDKLGSCRAEFSASLERWLSQVHTGNVEKDAKRPEKRPLLVPDRTVFLYPDGQNAAAGNPGESNGAVGAEAYEGNPADQRLMNVGDSARFQLFLADQSKSNGQCVVVCPGGGYKYSAQLSSGEYFAKWLLEQGVSVALLKYRLPLHHWTVPLTDVQNTMRYLRANASELGIRQLGVAGFSAGGHLAASASVLYVDAQTRPDFSILLYPVITMERGVTHNGTRANLLGHDSDWAGREAEHKALIEKYSLENQVTGDTPRTFIVLCTDDKTVPAENSARYFTRLTECKVPCEMHAFPVGGHGWGFRSGDIGTDGIYSYRSDLLSSLSRFLRETSAL